MARKEMREALIRAFGAGLILFLAFVAGSTGLLGAPPNASPEGGAPAAARTPAGSPCTECIRIRVGLPRVARGPSPGIPDSKFTEIRLPDGRFRGFSASATTYAIDGPTPWAMGGPAVPVLGPGAPGSYGASGKWINHVERSGNILLGWVHDETGDAPGQGLKSMSLAISKDDGLHWEDIGQIITGKDSLTHGKVTGEGDCGAVNGQDGYYYAYCGRTRDGATIVARAPVDNPAPKHWLKYYNGQWGEPGLGGDATGLASKSAGLARWATTGQTVALGWLPGGLGLFFSRDHVAFSAVREPLLDLDTGIWRRPDPSELLAYFALLDASNGGEQLGDRWMMAYTYLQPNETFGQRYLVFRPVDVSFSPTPVSPQVGVLLARWYNKALHDHWSTTAPVPDNHGAYALEAQSGYLLTAVDPAKPSVQLEDCVSFWPGHPDHVLEVKGVCEAGHYARLRTAGWIYQKPQAQTVPLYRCYSARDKSHFASNKADCEGLGAMERLLGYALSQ
jgi:hypothetical protein